MSKPENKQLRALDLIFPILQSLLQTKGTPHLKIGHENSLPASSSRIHHKLAWRQIQQNDKLLRTFKAYSSQLPAARKHKMGKKRRRRDAVANSEASTALLDKLELDAQCLSLEYRLKTLKVQRKKLKSQLTSKEYDTCRGTVSGEVGEAISRFRSTVNSIL